MDNRNSEKFFGLAYNVLLVYIIFKVISTIFAIIIVLNGYNAILNLSENVSKSATKVCVQCGVVTDECQIYKNGGFCDHCSVFTDAELDYNCVSCGKPISLFIANENDGACSSCHNN